ncbi:nucleoside-diphosphate kinase [Burkholderia gladioli]|uniref:nucleoside-diphosphate kinase n=1 Tax=Burkholderia gladioli TaxID=28095 RepID=UPI001640DAD0|nr:nucleoside-diphosphate kinase [Burkholderia gladioli]
MEIERRTILLFNGPMLPLETVLTPNRIKHRYYWADADFRHAMEVIRGHWICTDRIIHRLWNYAALILRPDAIAGGQSAAVLPMLRQHGFIPVAVKRVHVGASRAEALWRYQFNVATPERRSVLKHLMSMGDSVYLIVRDDTVRTSAPATVHLTYLKGTAVIERRKPGHLRTVAGPAVANIFSYVHVSDDPADVLREMAVLFDDFSIRALLAQIDSGVDRSAEAYAALRELQSLVPKNALFHDVGASIDRAVDEDKWRIASEWRDLVERAKRVRSFMTGESYAGADATIPDDTELSLPLDGHLVFAELGPR